MTPHSLRQNRHRAITHPSASSFFEVEAENAIDPNATSIKLWYQVLLLCTLYETFLIPFFLAFKPNAVSTLPIEVYLAMGCECIFFIDLIIQAHTGYYYDGNIIRNNKKTRRRYLLSYRFVLDLIALIPFSWFGIAIHTARAWFEVHKLIRCIKIGTYIAALDDLFVTQFAKIKLLKVIGFALMLTHMISCIRFWFGFDVDHSNHWLPPSSTSNQTVLHKYLMSFFWSFGMLTGLYEGELPYTMEQFVFVMFVAVCGFSLFTSLCATLFMISRCESGQDETTEARINQLKHLLSFHRVPGTLQKQALEYLRQYHTDVESNDREVMRMLCPSISKDIQVELVKDTVRNIAIFSGCSDEFIVALTSLLELISIPAQSTVFVAGSYGDAMYIVQSGVQNVLVNGIKVRELRKGTCFGEISVFSDHPRTATIICATYSTLYKLSRLHSERLLEGYPSCAESIAITVSKTFRNNPSRHTSNPSSPSKIALVPKKVDQFKHHVSIKSFFGSKDKKYNESTIAPSIEHGSTGDNEEEAISEQPNRYDTLQNRIQLYEEQINIAASTPRKEQSHPILRSHFRKLLFKQCIDAESTFRMRWLILLQFVLLYNWLVVPTRICFPVFKRPFLFVDAMNVITDSILVLDVYFNFNLSYVHDAEKIMDPVQSSERYLHGEFAFDLFCSFPYSLLTWYVQKSTSAFVVLRFPRLFRAWRCQQHFNEVNKYLRLTNRQILIVLGIVLFMLYHLIACLHFGVTNVEGFSPKEEAWIPSDDIYLEQINHTHYYNLNHTILTIYDMELKTIAVTQYFRSLYYATNVLAALGKTIEPESELQYIMALMFMTFGFLITAIVVDNVQKRFTATAAEHKQFYATRTRIQLFLLRQNAPLTIFQRVNAFLDFWWSSHRGAFIDEALADLPIIIKHDILRNIYTPALQTFSLLINVRPVLNKLEELFVANAKVILYGQGEIIYRQGDYATGMFFLLHGGVCVIVNARESRTIPLGGYFGTAVLGSTTDGYGEHVSATTGSILLFLSKENLVAMRENFPPLFDELLSLERSLLKSHMVVTRVLSSKSSRWRSMSRRATVAVQNVFSVIPRNKSFDPDSKLILIWETWLFLAMTIQWITVVFQVCFRMVPLRHFQADCISAFFELSFFIDIYVRLHVGYYAFGNKVTDLKTIRSSYLKSTTFLLDLIALIPFYIYNWSASLENRLDVLNMNKLVRLLKVPAQLRSLENRYLKRTTELRIFKLFYYTFMLSHIFGCLWFEFASNSSHLYSWEKNPLTHFGINKWTPSLELETSELNHQYFASLFWSFALMSASSPGELPKTITECIFTVITMTSGFFLFAYVIGNFTDIIELVDGDNRQFNEKLASVRMLLAHFTLPSTIEERLKTFYCFKRFHTITQEPLLEQCLPPSLLTDIRLVHLKPMIDKVSFLSGMEGSVTRMLVSQFCQVIVLRDQYVCKCGEVAYEMYFVFTGMLDILIPAPRAEHERIDTIERTVTTLFLDPDNPFGVLKKVNTISSGDYFGENGLFTNSSRMAYVRALTSCILYRLSRESLELVFERYPEWKEKVIQIANLQHEQQRLAHLSAEEQKRHTGEGGSMLSRIDIVNQKAERMEEKLHFAQIRRTEQANTGTDDEHIWQEWLNALRTNFCYIIKTFVYGAEAQSIFHLRWLRFTSFFTVFIAFIVPYRIVLDPMNRDTTVLHLLHLLELTSEIWFALDIWFSWHVKASSASMELYEQSNYGFYSHSRLCWDVIAALPIDRMLMDFTSSAWIRLLHCAKIANIVTYFGELHRRSVSYEKNRFQGMCLIYFLVIYWAGCAYLAVCEQYGFGEEWDSWLPSKKLELDDSSYISSKLLMIRFLRGFFFGITAFIKKGKTFTPPTTPLFIFTVLAYFLGLLVMALMIGTMATLFISYISNEVDFRKNHIAVELYLNRLKIKTPLKQRTHLFMSSLWSSHGGVNYQEIFEDMPYSLRSACIMHIAQKPLRSFTSSAFRLLSFNTRHDLEELMHSIAEHLKFEGYPKDEDIVTEGSISRAMYFVIKGHLGMHSRANSSIARVLIRHGEFFGDQGLLGCVVSPFTVTTLCACEMLSLSTESLLTIVKQNTFTQVCMDIIQNAHKKLLEGQKDAQYSKQEMENVWGEALFKVLQELSSLSDCRSMARNSPDIRKDPITTYRETLLSSVKNPSECFRLFIPFVQLLTPHDPLDWSAMVRRNSVDLCPLARRTSTARALNNLTLKSETTPPLPDLPTPPLELESARIAFNNHAPQGREGAATYKEIDRTSTIRETIARHLASTDDFKFSSGH